jgi:rhomboid protease GluP
MSLNYVLLWMVAASCVATIARSLRGGTDRSWLVVSIGILVLTSVVAIIDADYSGLIGGALWGLLVVIPSVCSRLITRAALAQHFGRAKALSRILAVLHPFGAWREQPALLDALDRAHRSSSVDEAVELLRPFLESGTPAASTAAAHYYRITGRWEEALAWLRAHPVAAFSDPTLVLLYIRALGETGDIEGMIQTLLNGRHVLRHSRTLALYANLFAFAFVGRKDLLTRLLRDSRMKLPDGADTFWIATADMAAGNLQAGRTALATLREKSVRPGWDVAIERRLTRPQEVVAGRLSPSAEARLSRIEAEYRDEENYAPVLRPDIARARMTNILIALNLAAFGVEIFYGGTTEIAVLYRLGALHTPTVIAGEWARVIVSTFLHFGPLHLLLNMLGLLVLGPFVERCAGAWRFLLLYLASGIGSMLLIVLFTFRQSGNADIVLGASGSVMGIVGATAAILWRGWRTYRSPVARRRLLVVLLIIVFQVVFDFSTPEVSFLGHTFGVLIGFALARRMRIEPRPPEGAP